MPLLTELTVSGDKSMENRNCRGVAEVIDCNSMPLVMQVITCRKSPERRRLSATAQLETLGLEMVTEVVDGLVDDDPVIDQLYDEVANRWRAKRPLSRSEISAYGSHRLAWQRLLANGHGAAFVVEDDFGLKDPEKVTAALSNWQALLGEGRDIVKLFDYEKRTKNRVAANRRVGELELVKWRSPTAGMVAYMVSRQGAEKLLARSKVFRQIDEDIKYFWELGLNVWSLPGNPVIEISDQLGGSLIESDRKRLKNRRLTRSIWGNLLTLDRKVRTRWHLARERKAHR
ncbi:glycosyltransferase family 25 protein [Pseudohoeflea coraliihabitans]|uniref:Glycosyltransferase family 25 protein n=1 Tax=Pseudohoeflea coraliihabitans TaxID=2860393 RepID=A0ABS6WRF4_9HYPH|nr:glycosyltransferase family 25 protein [Pseudohoeflea sp. DP4N28-3]MBW3098360.1 glycosyltransferase family 25 protein [Pseudohoeflea sp. DP4N28-3]